MPVTQLVTRTKYRLLVLSFAFLVESYLKIEISLRSVNKIMKDVYVYVD